MCLIYVNITVYLTIMYLTFIIKTPSGLIVTIKVEYNPPADFCPATSVNLIYFRPATSVNLTCHVEGSSGPFSYQWSSTGLNNFVVNSSSSIVRGAILTSNDAGSHTCNVNDSDGNIGSSTIEMKMEGEDLRS